MQLYEANNTFGDPSQPQDEVHVPLPNLGRTDTPLEEQVRVLARIPDVSQPEDSATAEPVRSGGRLISERLSTKLLIGGGVLLLLVAIVPFLFHKPEPQGGKPPAPDADLAPAFHAPTSQSQRSEAVEQVVHPVVQMAPPELNFQSNIPMAPEFLAQGGPNTPAEGSPPPSLEGSQSAPVMSEAGSAPGIYDRRYQMQQPGRRYSREYQPPAAAQPPLSPENMPQQRTDQPPPASSPQVMLNRSMQLDRQATQPVVASQPYYQPPSTRPADQGNPGVARLQGIIEKPTIRTPSADTQWE